MNFYEALEQATKGKRIRVKDWNSSIYAHFKNGILTFSYINGETPYAFTLDDAYKAWEIVEPKKLLTWEDISDAISKAEIRIHSSGNSLVAKINKDYIKEKLGF